jgi:hypothetical protein
MSADLSVWTGAVLWVVFIGLVWCGQKVSDRVSERKRKREREAFGDGYRAGYGDRDDEIARDLQIAADLGFENGREIGRREAAAAERPVQS